MAHAMKCAGPEGNRGRDEWMTVIEMQEYMGGEPKQGVRPHLVGKDRLVQARKEAPGFEGVSGRLHRVEERQEMTTVTALGAARGRACERASRRKELENDHDQEHLRISRDAMYRLAPLHSPPAHAIRLLVAF